MKFDKTEIKAKSENLYSGWTYDEDQASKEIESGIDESVIRMIMAGRDDFGNFLAEYLEENRPK